MFLMVPKSPNKMALKLSLRNSNTFRDGMRRKSWSLKWLLAGLAAVCLVDSTAALSSSKAISQYIRDEWGIEQGFPGGRVYAIAQTPDGYLWIGAEKGLVRFDGLSFRLLQGSDTTTLPVGPVLGLLVDAEGNLWVRPLGQRLLRYKDGVFQDILENLKLAGADVTAMCTAKNGEILFSRFVHGTVRYTNGRLLPLASQADLPKLVISLAEADDGRVWLGTRAEGVYYISDGRVFLVTKGLPDRKINALLPVGGHDLWVSTDNGIALWNGNEFSQSGVPNALKHAQALTMIRDRASNVWLGTPNGLMRVDANGETATERGRHGFNNAVTALFEDREGNLWVGTANGITRFRDNVFTTFSVSNGLPSEANGPVYVDAGGRTWFAPQTGRGLFWLKDGEVGRLKEGGLDTDIVYSIGGRRNELWVGRQQGGLTHFVYKDNGNSFTTTTYTQAEGLAQNSVYAVHQSRDGTVWAGTLSAGLSRFKNGAFTTFTTANGLISNTITSIIEAADGTMWFGTPNGVNALSNGRWRAYTSADGLPPGNVNCLFEDSAGVLWMGTANGIAFLRARGIEDAGEAPSPLREPIYGIAEDRNGSLWIATANHILRIERGKALSRTLSDADVREYGLMDGLLSMQGAKREKSVVADSVGRIWFSTNRGLSFADPTLVAASSAPAIVHVEEMSADGRAIALGGPTRVSAPHNRITLSYSGLSLSVPSRVRFKYRLDGFDKDWSGPTGNREAIYTNLDSGMYRFRVLASSSEGLWNGGEASLNFRIEPVFWQTWWFRLALTVSAIIVAVALIRLRIRTLASHLNVRFEERLLERTRIAQELHDTLLQGFLSASMQLHVANEHLSTDSQAKPFVKRALELMGQVSEESRNAVRGLRMSKGGTADLQQAFSQVWKEFPVNSQIEFRVIVEGGPRALHPLISEEIYLIGHEALSNAFRHSQAREIEVELEYAASHLRVIIRDDGDGIDPEVLRSGREGHWGLSGMKERTQRIGGRLRVLSRAVAGTEIELSVPAKIAFESRQEDRRVSWLSRRFSGKRQSNAPQSGPRQVS
jgi:signal transduction histidine kinase/ligand-binding sensor domain-containing protein